MEEDFKFSGHVTSLARCFIVLAQVFSSYRARPCVRQNEEAETTDAVGLGSVAGSHARFPNHTMAACIEAGILLAEHPYSVRIRREMMPGILAATIGTPCELPRARALRI